jgi:hypothetical protein
MSVIQPAIERELRTECGNRSRATRRREAGSSKTYRDFFSDLISLRGVDPNKTQSLFGHSSDDESSAAPSPVFIHPQVYASPDTVERCPKQAIDLRTPPDQTGP